MAEEIFTASTENLRDLKKQRKRICALVNRAIREKQDPDLISLTKRDCEKKSVNKILL